MHRKLIVLGCGGHGRVVLEAAQQTQAFEPVGFLDVDSRLWGRSMLGCPVLGGDERLADLGREVAFIVGVGSVGRVSLRATMFERALSYGLVPATIIHPAATVSPSATIGAGSVLLPRSVVHTGATLGVNVIVNTGAIIEHDCHVGDHTHVATAAALAGAVNVGRAVHVGAGATVLQHLTVGDGAVIGAGAVVIRPVPADEIVVGVPARQYVGRRPRAES